MRLRAVTDADIPVLFEHQLDPAAHQMAAFSTQKNWDEFLAHWQKVRSNDQNLMFAIEVDDEVVGVVGKWMWDADDELTYWIDPKRWGLGLATRAVELFLQRYHRRPIFAHCAADNLGSIRVLERSGFIQHEQLRGFAPARNAEIDELGFRLDTKPVAAAGVQRFFDSDGRLVSMPVKWPMKVELAAVVAADFEVGREYDEREVNRILMARFDDYVYLRRLLVDLQHLVRDTAGATYRRDSGPTSI